jgi:hypothetical protein
MAAFYCDEISMEHRSSAETGALTLIDRFPPTAPDRFCQVRGAFTPFSPEIGSSLGSGYDWAGLYIHGVVRGRLGKRADASTKRSGPTASNRFILLSPGISGFPGKRNKSLRRNAKMRSRRYRCYSGSKSRCRSADVRLLKSRDCIGGKCGLRFGIPRAGQQIRPSFKNLSRISFLFRACFNPTTDGTIMWLTESIKHGSYP